MGGVMACFHEPDSSKRPAARRKKPGAQKDAAFTEAVGSSKRWDKGRSVSSVEESLIQEAAALLLLQQQQNGGGGAAISFDRSTSLRYSGMGVKKQLILHPGATMRTLYIKEADCGIDFLFGNHIHGIKFVDFISSSIPVKSRSDKQLVSQDPKNNTYNYKHTVSVEICPICREDLMDVCQ